MQETIQETQETIQVTRRQTFRLYPNKAQEKALLSARRLHCYLYNACVSHRQYEYKQNRRTVGYLEQQNLLPEFKQVWTEFAQLHSQSLQATVKRVDLAYQSFFQGLRGKPKYKSIRQYSGWTYPAQSGWQVNSDGKHGTVTLNDLGITLKMRGKAKDWGVPTTLTIVYKPSQRQWYASITVQVEVPKPKFGSQSDTRDRGSVMVMYNVATNQQPGLGTNLVSLGCFSSTSETRRHTGSMKQLGQKKRRKSRRQAEGASETPSAYAVG